MVQQPNQKAGKTKAPSDRFEGRAIPDDSKALLNLSRTVYSMAPAVAVSAVAVPASTVGAVAVAVM